MPIGVLTRQELSRARCRQAAAEACGQSHGASTLLTVVGGAAPHLRPVQKLKDAANLMLDTSRKAAAVVNQALQLLGVVSEADLLRAMVGQV
jgi:CBS domain-containing protein